MPPVADGPGAVLALDASGAACSVALRTHGRISARRSVAMARGHAEALMPMVEEVLREAGCAYGEIACIGVTVGPGSFTGIRTAIAAARGLALALGRPALGVTTLEAVALAARRAATAAAALDCLVVLDTRRDDLYAQVFAPDGAPRTQPVASMPEPLVSGLGPAPILLAGDAAMRVAALLAARNIPVHGPVGGGAPDAAIVAEIAARRFAGGAATAARPLYLRPPDAIKPIRGGRLRP